MTMDVEKTFHMNGGHGDTSYAENSSNQKSVADWVMPIMVDTIQKTYLALKPESLGIADLGCSSAPEELSKIKQIINVVEKSRHTAKQPDPSVLHEIRVCLNDLPTNDFNTIFKVMPDFYSELKEELGDTSVYVAAYPGSFYGRLFPDNSLHFIFSLYCLHWLSKVPPGIYDEHGVSLNEKSIYISNNSPPKVWKAYLDQFQDDFSLFLRSRSKEMVNGGRMVLMMLGRSGSNASDGSRTLFWEVLYQALSTLVRKGIVEEEKVDSFDVHYYEPSGEEIEDEVRKEGSFKLERLQVLEYENVSVSGESRGKAVAKAVRAIQESMIAHHFGETILDILFEEYGRLYDEMTATQVVKSINLALVLRKM